MKDVTKKYLNMIEEVLKLKPSEIFKIKETSIYVCDDFDELDEDLVDNIWDFFNTVKQMTEEQIKCIHESKWNDLSKII